MTRLRALTAILALAASAAAAPAFAQQVRTPADTAPNTRAAFAASAPTLSPPANKSVQWSDKGRWGLSLDVEDPAYRDLKWKDVQAGAYFKVTPSLRVGGALGVADAGDRSRPEPAPKVKLETAFRF